MCFFKRLANKWAEVGCAHQVKVDSEFNSDLCDMAKTGRHLHVQ